MFSIYLFLRLEDSIAKLLIRSLAVEVSIVYITDEESENLNFSACKELFKKGISKPTSMPKDRNLDLVLQHYMQWEKCLIDYSSYYYTI